MDPESALVNENLWIGLEEEEPPHRRMVCRQISGLIARRIVCDLRPGQVVERGEKFGMIKLGSRTELILPAEGLTVRVRVGETVKAGRDVIAKYEVSQATARQSLAAVRSHAERGNEIERCARFAPSPSCRRCLRWAI